jgi:hypothetical protein
LFGGDENSKTALFRRKKSAEVAARQAYIPVRKKQRWILPSLFFVFFGKP